MAAAQDLLLRYDEGESVYDVRVTGADLAGDSTLGTAVLVSLLTDADYRRQLELKKESQKQEIIEALASSGKSYNEIMSFLLGKEKK